MKRSLVFLNSHPIQYFAPLYREIEKSGLFDFEVWYCSKHGLAGEHDRQFGTAVKWDIPVLEGYRHRFLRNFSLWPSIYGFWGLVNPEIILQLWRLPRRSIVVVHGWAYLTHWLSIFATLFGHTLCIRAESPLKHESGKKGWKNALRKWLIRWGLFRLTKRFLYIGTQNRLFFQHFGAREDQLIFTPYSVDNDRFREEAQKLLPQKNEIRRQLGLPENAFIVLFSGKYIDKKRPLDLLEALDKMDDPRIVAVFVGEGALRPQMEAFIEKRHLRNRAILTGFINQSAIPRYYAIADLFAICSGVGETWGLVTNEAMNFGLPIVASDLTGSSDDLVEENQNGFTFSYGDTDDLARKIAAVAAMPESDRVRFGTRSLEIIDRYSYQTIIAGLQKI